MKLVLILLENRHPQYKIHKKKDSLIFIQFRRKYHFKYVTYIETAGIVIFEV